MTTFAHNTVRFETKGKIFFTVYGFNGNKPDAITGCFCKAKDLPRREGEQEDAFVERLSRKMARRHFWKNLMNKIFFRQK